MKYRVKEVSCHGERPWFYPQRKWLFFWHNIDDGTWRDDLYYSTLAGAKMCIKCLRTPKKITIYSVDDKEI